MTKDEAQKELAELEPRERQMWKEIEARRVEAELYRAAWQQEHNKRSGAWLPLYNRVQKLKTFLEIV